MCLLNPRRPSPHGKYSALSDDTCPAQALYFKSDYFHNHFDHHLILSSFFFAVDLPFSLLREMSLRPGDLASVFLLHFHLYHSNYFCQNRFLLLSREEGIASFLVQWKLSNMEVGV